MKSPAKMAQLPPTLNRMCSFNVNIKLLILEMLIITFSDLTLSNR